jgi:hypothetical protein
MKHDGQIHTDGPTTIVMPRSTIDGCFRGCLVGFAIVIFLGILGLLILKAKIREANDEQATYHLRD